MRTTVSTVLAALLALVCATGSVGAAPLAAAAQPAETAHGAGLDDLHRLAVPCARPKLQLRRDRVDGPPSISSAPSSDGSRAWPPSWSAAAAQARVAAAAEPPAEALLRSERIAERGPGGREVSSCRTSRGPPPRA